MNLNLRNRGFEWCCAWFLLSFMLVSGSARQLPLANTLPASNSRPASQLSPPPDVSPTPQASPTPLASPNPSPTPSPTPSLEREFFKNLLRDQKTIFTSPFHTSRKDARYLFPLGAATAVFLITDQRTTNELIENGDNQSRLRISHNVSRLGSAYVTGAIAAAFYLGGRLEKNNRARETGLLAGEALIDSGITVEAIKLIAERQRPPTDNGHGEFLDGGSSFPSGHAVSAWSLATVIASEYHDRPLIKYGAYGLATAVSLSRYTGRNHFLSDVLIGSAIGYVIGRYVYLSRTGKTPPTAARRGWR